MDDSEDRKLTAEEFVEVLKRAHEAELIGVCHQVGWYDGPIMGFAVLDSVYDLLPENMQRP